MLYGRGTPDGAPEAAPSPEPVTVLKRAEAALATAPAPAERAAPPAATIPPAFAVAAAPTAAPALKRNKNLNIKINVSKELRAIYKKIAYVKVVTGFRSTARIRQTMMATPISPATPPRDDKAATTALVSHDDAGSGSAIPVAFWSYNIKIRNLNLF